MTEEHYNKYDLIAHELGISNLLPLVPFSKESIQQALSNGDEYLNKWGNFPWDQKHQQVLNVCRKRYHRYYGMKSFVWSLCATVCVLKHVARYYL